MRDIAIRSELELAAARYVLGQIRSSEVVQLADEMLNRGVFSEGFTQLWCLSDVTMSEVAPLFEAALCELGVSLPSRADAKRLLVADILTPIVNQRSEPLKGLVAFMEWVCRTCQSEECDQIALCASMGLMDLVDEYYSLGELEFMRSSRELNPQYYADELLKLQQGVVKAAHRWLTSTTQG